MAKGGSSGAVKEPPTKVHRMSGDGGSSHSDVRLRSSPGYELATQPQMPSFLFELFRSGARMSTGGPYVPIWYKQLGGGGNSQWGKVHVRAAGWLTAACGQPLKGEQMEPHSEDAVCAKCKEHYLTGLNTRWTRPTEGQILATVIGRNGLRR